MTVPSFNNLPPRVPPRGALLSPSRVSNSNPDLHLRAGSGFLPSRTGPHTKGGDANCGIDTARGLSRGNHTMCTTGPGVLVCGFEGAPGIL